MQHSDFTTGKIETKPPDGPSRYITCKIKLQSFSRSIFLPLVFFFLFFQAKVSFAQSIDDLIEFFTVHTNKKALMRDPSAYPAKVIMSPVVTYAPETSWSFGVGAKYLFKLPGSGPETRTSNMPISLQYTLENQFVIFSGFEIFSPQEKWMLTGNLDIRSFSQLYFGIGNNSPETNEEEFDFSQVLIEPILLKQTPIRYLFAGAGIRYNFFGGVEALPDGILDNSEVSGAHGSTSVGAEFAIVYDNRDNLLNAQNGLYAEFTHGFYGKVFGGTNEFQLTRLDLRYFTQPFRKNDDVLAFQLKTHFSFGDTPLWELGRLGSEEIMRGYYEGRFIDRHLIAVQTEYRKHLFGRWGMVAFAGVGEVASDFSSFSFSNLKPSVGLGLRFLLEEKENLNIRLDWGFGDRTNNYYINIAEAF